MKFWLPLIFGTIAVSAFLTYLNLYKGAQTLDAPVHPPLPTAGKLVFSDPVGNPLPSVNVLANVVELDCGTTFVGESYSFGITLENKGEGPLELSLREKGTCECANFFVDKKEITMSDPRVKIEPGKSAKFSITFKPHLRLVADSFRNRISFEHNDPRFNDLIHFEFVSSVKSKP